MSDGVVLFPQAQVCHFFIDLVFGILHLLKKEMIVLNARIQVGMGMACVLLGDQKYFYHSPHQRLGFGQTVRGLEQRRIVAHKDNQAVFFLLFCSQRLPVFGKSPHRLFKTHT